MEMKNYKTWKIYNNKKVILTYTKNFPEETIYVNTKNDEK